MSTPRNLEECYKELDKLTAIFNEYKKRYEYLESQYPILRAKLEASFKERGLSFEDTLREVEEERKAKTALKNQEANGLSR